ncbi:hypothetical protein Tco_0202540, partial [Tanacetum coccineum]
KKYDDDADDDKSIDLEKTNDEETDDEFVHSEECVQDNDEETDDELVHGDEQVNDDEEEEMTNAEEVEIEEDDKGITDAKKTKATKDTTDAEINSLLYVQIQQEIPHIQSPSILTVPVFVIPEPSILSPIPKIPSVALATTLLPPPPVSTI